MCVWGDEAEINSLLGSWPGDKVEIGSLWSLLEGIKRGRVSVVEMVLDDRG